MSLNYDQSTDETAYFIGVLPQSYAGGTLTANIFWTATTTGNVVWNVGALGRVNDEVWDSALAAVDAVTDGVTAANDLMVAAVSMATPTLAAGDLLVLSVVRDANNGSDTLAADAKLIAVELQE
jgi:hypothetical protein